MVVKNNMNFELATNYKPSQCTSPMMLLTTMTQLLIKSEMLSHPAEGSAKPLNLFCNGSAIPGSWKTRQQ